MKCIIFWMTVCRLNYAMYVWNFFTVDSSSIFLFSSRMNRHFISLWWPLLFGSIVYKWILFVFSFHFISFLSFTLEFIAGRARIESSHSWSYIVVFISISTEVVDYQCVLIIFACITINTIRFSNKSLLKGLAGAWYIKFKAQPTKGHFKNSNGNKNHGQTIFIFTAVPLFYCQLKSVWALSLCDNSMHHKMPTLFFPNSFPLLLCASCLFASL